MPAGSFYYVENGEAGLVHLVRADLDGAPPVRHSSHGRPRRRIAEWSRELAVLSARSTSHVRLAKARAELKRWKPQQLDRSSTG